MLWECDWEIFKKSVFEVLIFANVKILMWLEVASILDATSRVFKQTQIFVFSFALWSSRVVINLLFARHLTKTIILSRLFCYLYIATSLSIILNFNEFKKAKNVYFFLSKIVINCYSYVNTQCLTFAQVEIKSMFDRYLVRFDKKMNAKSKRKNWLRDFDDHISFVKLWRSYQLFYNCFERVCESIACDDLRVDDLIELNDVFRIS